MINEMIVRTPANEWVDLLERLLSPFPERLLTAIKEYGLKIYILDHDTRASYIGLTNGVEMASHGRTYDDEDMAWFNRRGYMVFYTKCFIEGDEFNTPLHEIGHALDWYLGRGEWWTCSKDFEPLLKTAKPLDCYAEINCLEYFAQGVEAYFRPERQVIDSYRVHTGAELAKVDPELFKLLTILLREE